MVRTFMADLELIRESIEPRNKSGLPGVRRGLPQSRQAAWIQNPARTQEAGGAWADGEPSAVTNDDVVVEDD
jgi:hypothetical protein